jgi:signal transduction histidine kinase
MLVAMMEQSTTRMGALIEDVIDLARSRLGGGALPLMRSTEPIQPLLTQVIDEMRIMHPDRKIEAEFQISKTICADRQRVARLLSNLLGNAITYSPPDSPVLVRAQTYGSFSLSVTNHGPAIPTTQLEKLFQPYVRGKGDGNLQGLGLGLYIVSQIASAHGGTIDVTSTDEATRFTFQMPLVPEEQAMSALLSTPTLV